MTHLHGAYNLSYSVINDLVVIIAFEFEVCAWESNG
jgi:hypothetical protein